MGFLVVSPKRVASVNEHFRWATDSTYPARVFLFFKGCVFGMRVSSRRLLVEQVSLCCRAQSQRVGTRSFCSKCFEALSFHTEGREILLQGALGGGFNPDFLSFMEAAFTRAGTDPLEATLLAEYARESFLEAANKMGREV